MKNTVALLRSWIGIRYKTEVDEMTRRWRCWAGERGWRDTVAMLDKTKVDEMDEDTVALVDRDTVVMLDKTEVHEPGGAAGRQRAGQRVGLLGVRGLC